MKRTKAFLMTFLCFLLVFTLCACAGNTPNGNQTEDTKTSGDSINNDMLYITSDGSSSYTLLRAERTSQLIIDSTANLSKAIKTATGVQLKITTDWSGNPISDYEIIVGTTERLGREFELDTSGLGEYDYIIRAVGHRIIILGGCDIATESAVNAFIAEYLTVTDGSLKNLSISVSLDISGTRDTSNFLTIMSQNLLATDTEYASHADNAYYTISVRYPRILSLIETHKPDSLGVQECSASWRSILDIRLKNGYVRVGADKNEKIGIIYNSNKLTLIDSGSFWLSPNPESQKVAYEWANNNPDTIERLGQYAVLEIKATGERYIHFNCHIGFETTQLALNQTQVLLDYIEKITQKYDYPVVITGDFNYNSSSEQYKLFTSGIMRDTKTLAQTASGAGTFNKLISDSYHPLAIDQIMVSDSEWTIFSYLVDYTKFDGYYASDHFAVVVKSELITE